MSHADPALSAPSRDLRSAHAAHNDEAVVFVDYDARLDRRYVMNHCERCGVRFSDSKLFAPSDGLFNGRGPVRVSRIAFRHWFGPVMAIGCVAPSADDLAISLDALYGAAARRADQGGEERGRAAR